MVKFWWIYSLQMELQQSKKWRALPTGLPKASEIFQILFKMHIFFLFLAVFQGFRQLLLRSFSWDQALWING